MLASDIKNLILQVCFQAIPPLSFVCIYNEGKKIKQMHIHCLNFFINLPARDKGPFPFLVYGVLRILENLY